MTSKKHNAPKKSIIKIISNLFLTVPILFAGYELGLMFAVLTYREIGGFILFSFGGVSSIITGIILGQFTWELVTGTIEAIIKKDMTIFYDKPFIGNITLNNVKNQIGTSKLKFKHFLAHIIFGMMGIAIAYGLRYFMTITFPEELPIMLNQMKDCIFITSLIMIAGNIFFSFKNDFTEKIKKKLIIIVPILLVLLMFVGAIRLMFL